MKNKLSKCNNGCSAKAISITLSENVFVALGIQRANTCAILPSLALPAVQKLSTLSHKSHDFWSYLIKICVLISLKLLSETFEILRRTEKDMIKKYILVFM